MLSFSSIMIFEISHVSYKNGNNNDDNDNFIKNKERKGTIWRKQ